MISLIVSIIIFLFLNLIINNFNKIDILDNSNSEKNIFYENSISEETSDHSENDIFQSIMWYIEIPSIKLKAPIKDGIDEKILNEYVGHFKDTALMEGNIGLAAHNRGYKNNYFENLKLVKIDDEIIYHYNDFECVYVIDTIEIIRNTDWSYLENEEENKITLITCVENEPNYRRCVQASQKNKYVYKNLF